MELASEDSRKPAPAAARRRARVVVLALAAACGAAELALRASADASTRGERVLPRVLQSRAAVRDERLGYRLLPDLLTHDAAGVAYRTNAHGYRDRAWPDPPDRAPGSHELRVAVLGDSVPYGSGVAVEQAFPRVLERRIAERLAPRDGVRVLSFAVPGYKLDQMLAVLEHEALAFEPDLVLLFLAPNGVREAPFDPADFRHELRADAGPLDEWFERSLLYRRAVDLLDGAARRGRSWTGLDRTRASLAAGDLRRSALDDLARARAALERDGVPLVVVANPWIEDVLGGRPSPWAAEVREGTGCAFVETAPLLRAAMPHLLQALADGSLRREEVWPVDEPPGAPVAARDEVLFLRHDRLHPSPAGHRALADGLLAELLARGLLDAARPTTTGPANPRRPSERGDR